MDDKNCAPFRLSNEPRDMVHLVHGRVLVHSDAAEDHEERHERGSREALEVRIEERMLALRHFRVVTIKHKQQNIYQVATPRPLRRIQREVSGFFHRGDNAVFLASDGGGRAGSRSPIQAQRIMGMTTTT